MYSILANATNGGAGGMLGMILWLVIIFAFMYFLMIRPQKKEQKKKDLMLSEVAVGDTVLTTAGFYGTIIDIVDDTVIVEFGNNKNCRIPMQKSSIADVEKPESATESKQVCNIRSCRRAAPFVMFDWNSKNVLL